MQKQLFIPSMAVATLFVLALGLLQGCGGTPESNEEFLDEIRNRSGAADGTLPPIGEPMEKMAKIRFETTELDVGEIANDKPHFTKLKVYNDGKMPLKITKIDTSCACTQGQISPERSTIQPGTESWIDIMIDPTRIPGFWSRKVLTITSTDPDNSFVEVGVTARVVPEYELDTTPLAVGEIMKGESVERTLRFRQLQEEPITVTRAGPLTTGARNPKVPGVSVEIIDIPEDQWQTPGKREYDLEFTIGPDLPAGEFNRIVVVSTDVKRFRGQVLEVTGTIMAPYRIVPIYPVRATLVPDSAVGGLQTAIDLFAESPIGLSNFSSDFTGLIMEAVPGDGPNHARLQVTIPGEISDRPLDEVIRFQVEVDGKAYDELAGVRFGVSQDEHDGHENHEGHEH